MVNRNIDQLPSLDQNLFPLFKDDMTGKTYKIFESKYGHSEEEAIIALIMTATVNHGKWEPLLVSEVFDLMNKDDVRRIMIFKNKPYEFFKALQHVVNGNDIKLINFNNNDYILPLPGIVETIRTCKITWYSVPAYHPNFDVVSEEPEVISDPTPPPAPMPVPKLGFFARLRRSFGF